MVSLEMAGRMHLYLQCHDIPEIYKEDGSFTNRYISFLARKVLESTDILQMFYDTGMSEMSSNKRDIQVTVCSLFIEYVGRVVQ